MPVSISSRKDLLQISGLRSGFEIVPEADVNVPTGVSQDVLNELMDIVVHFGQDWHKGLGFKTEPVQISLCYIDMDRVEMIVRKVREAGTANHDGIVVFDLINGIRVLWDKGVTFEDVKKFIDIVNDWAVMNELKNGEALFFIGEPNPVLSHQFAVAYAFADKDSFQTVSPPEKVEEVIGYFDYPKLVTWIAMDSLRIICLATEKELIEEYVETLYVRLGEKGISRKQAASMSWIDLSHAVNMLFA